MRGRPRAFTDQALRDAVASGHTYEEIATLLDCSVRIIHTHCRRLGLRPPLLPLGRRPDLSLPALQEIAARCGTVKEFAVRTGYTYEYACVLRQKHALTLGAPPCSPPSPPTSDPPTSTT